MIFFHDIVVSHAKIPFRGGSVVKYNRILRDAFDCQEIGI